MINGVFNDFWKFTHLSLTELVAKINEIVNVKQR